jgi:hypothetical protein
MNKVQARMKSMNMVRSLHEHVRIIPSICRIHLRSTVDRFAI